MVYAEAPEEARRNGTFQSWITENYVRRQGVAVRRQVDRDPDVVSLGRLIDGVRRYPNVLSRDRYFAQTSDFQDRADAGESFDLMVGAGRDHIDGNVPRADLARLKTRTEKVVRWVDNEVAHYNRDKGQFSVGLTFGDIHGAIALIVDLFLKYTDLIIGKSIVPSVTMNPWIGIFQQAWIPDFDRLVDLNTRIEASQSVTRAGFDFRSSP